MNLSLVAGTLASCRQQLLLSIRDASMLSFLIRDIPLVGVISWAATQSDDPSVLTYIAFGAPIFALWNGAIFRMGGSVTAEMRNGTFDFVLASPTPILAVITGKTLAHVLYGLPSALLALLLVLAVFQEWPPIDSPAMFGVTLACLALSVISFGMLVSPAMVLARGQGGFFNALILFSVTFSGFVYPVSSMPVALEVVARMFPTSWAMEAVRLTSDGSSEESVIFAWSMAALSILIMGALTVYLFRIVEKRVRRLGTV